MSRRCNMIPKVLKSDDQFWAAKLLDLCHCYVLCTCGVKLSTEGDCSTSELSGREGTVTISNDRVQAGRRSSSLVSVPFEFILRVAWPQKRQGQPRCFNKVRNGDFVLLE